MGLGHFLAGKISDRIRGGKLPDGVQVTGPRPEGSNPPKPSSIRHGKGHGLGKGASRKRSGEGAE